MYKIFYNLSNPYTKHNNFFQANLLGYGLDSLVGSQLQDTFGVMG